MRNTERSPLCAIPSGYSGHGYLPYVDCTCGFRAFACINRRGFECLWCGAYISYDVLHDTPPLTRQEQHEEIERRRDAVLAEYNERLPVYEPR